MDLQSIALNAPFENGKGARIATLQSKDRPLTWVTKEPLRAPFPPNSFEGSTRLGLCFVTNASVEADAQKLDERIVDLAWRNSSEIWKRELSREEVQAMHNPIIKRNDNYPNGLLRTKVCTTGPKTLRCWTNNGEPREIPNDWRGIEAVPLVRVVGIYIQGKEFGVIIETTDLKITETQTSCPF